MGKSGGTYVVWQGLHVLQLGEIERVKGVILRDRLLDLLYHEHQVGAE